MRGYKLSSVITFIFVVIVNVVLWQNCAPGFESQSISTDANNLGSGTNIGGSSPGDNQTPGSGGTLISNKADFESFQKIIQQRCNSCHGGADSNFPEISNFAKLKTLNDWLLHPKNLLVGGEPTQSLVYRRLRLARGINDSAIQNMPVSKNEMTQGEADFVMSFIGSLKKVEDRCKDHNVVAEESSLRRLNKTEIVNSIKLLTNIDHPFANINTSDGGAFGRNGDYQVTDQNFFEVYFNDVEAVADKYVNLRANENCNNQSGNRLSTCLQNKLRPIAELAFRKELNQNDLNIFLDSINKLDSNKDHSYSVKEKLKVGLMSILTSPQFLYVIREGTGSGDKYFTDFEIATKLSLALWQQIPNRNLWDKAKAGDFTNKNKLAAAVTEMLNHANTVENYSYQFLRGWLNIDKIFEFSPDPQVLGVSKNQFTPLATDFRNESIQIFRDHFATNKNIDQLVTGSTRFLSERLARHLGINSNVRGNDLQKFELPPNSPYAGSGLLTSSLLVSTSLPERSSIVFRGENILYSFYCGHVGAPPDNVEPINFEDLGPNASQRDIAIAHSKNPNCASCHSQIDPFGLALENFSPLGQFRNIDKFNNRIIASSSFEGENFNGVKELSQVLTKDNHFRKCFTEINLSYFLTKSLRSKESLNQYCAIKDIDQKVSAKTDSTKSLLQEILTSDYFLKWKDR